MERVQLVFSIVVAGSIVGFIATDGWGWPFAAVTVLSAGGFGLVARLILRMLARSRSGSRFARDMQAAEEEMFELTTEQARERALLLLGDSRKFRCEVVSAETGGQIDALGPELRDLFSQYSRVAAVAGEARLDRQVVGQSKLRSTLLRVGTDSDDTEIVVRPGGDRLYEIDGSEATETELEESAFPSVYHWLLGTAWTLYPEGESTRVSDSD